MELEFLKRLHVALTPGKLKSLKGNNERAANDRALKKAKTKRSLVFINNSEDEQ